MLIREQFRKTSPRLTEFKAVETIKIVLRGEITKKRDKPYQPLALRWANMKQNTKIRIEKGH